MNPVLLGLTRSHIRLFARGGFVRTQTMRTARGIQQEVAIFASHKPISLGECTPFKTIIVHESVPDNRRLSNYVLIHELAHKKQWWSYLKIPPLCLVFFGLVSGPRVTMCVLSLVILFALSWVLELDADFIAIKHGGLGAFLEARAELRRIMRPSVSSMFISRLTHPPLGVTVRIWHWLHNHETFRRRYLD